MVSGGESSKTCGSSAINTVSLTENDIPGARLPREVPEECIVKQLKRWLSCRGACTTGKKQQLITRLVSFHQDFEICLLQVNDLQCSNCGSAQYGIYFLPTSRQYYKLIAILGRQYHIILTARWEKISILICYRCCHCRFHDA